MTVASGMGGKFAVAHGVRDGPVPDDLPYVPDLFILQEGGRFWSVARISGDEVDIGRLGYEHMVSGGEAMPLDEPVPWEPGRWAAVEGSGLSFFDRSGEERWRSERAQALLREATDLKGDPERALSLLRASGALVNIQLPGLVGYLERERKRPDEDLSEVYLRVKK